MNRKLKQFILIGELAVNKSGIRGSNFACHCAFCLFQLCWLGETFSISLRLPVPKAQRQNNNLHNNKYSPAGIILC